MSVMVMMALGSSLIPARTEENFAMDRTGLLSGSLISAVLIFQFAIRNSPSSNELALTPLIEYILISLGFIGVAFLEYCLITVIGLQVKKHRQLDLAFFLLSSISYAAFVSFFWTLSKSQSDLMACHNILGGEVGDSLAVMCHFHYTFL